MTRDKKPSSPAPVMRRPSSLTARVFAVAVAILFAPGFFQGCSGCTCEECFAQGVADRVRYDAAKDYVYSTPISATEKEARAYVTAAGYALPPEPFARTSHIVGRRAVGADEMKLDFSPVGKDRYRLEITYVNAFTYDDGGVTRTPSRSVDAEWEIASRVDPSFAAKTNEKAANSRERAGTVGRGCDRGCELGCRACETCNRTAR